MWTPKEAEGFGAALRPPIGSGQSPSVAPRAKPRKLHVADSRHFECKFPKLQDAFYSMFLVILCCPVVIFV